MRGCGRNLVKAPCSRTFGSGVYVRVRMLYAVQVLRTAVSVCVRLSSFDGVFGRSNALCPCGGSVWWVVMGRDGCSGRPAVVSLAWCGCVFYCLLSIDP